MGGGVWISCSQKWGIATVVEQLHEITKRSRFQKLKWLNLGQMLDHYKVEAVVAALAIELKKNPLSWRPNPQCPTTPEAFEFKCLVIDEETIEETQLKETLMNLKAKLTQQAAASIYLRIMYNSVSELPIAKCRY